MSNSNRATILTKVHKVLKKHYKPVEPPSDRKVLEQLLFSAILENADFETAQENFAKLQECYFDWNEVRVTTVAELAEMLASLPDATDAAQRIKRTLQAVFETYYQFDLEPFKKQNLGKSVADLEKMVGISSFMVAYLTQTALAGHAIALGRGAWDVLMAVGAAAEVDWQKQHVAGMERAIPKTKGSEFFSLLHQCGVDLAASPQSTRVKGILAEIDAGAKDRLTEWQQRKTVMEKLAANKLAADKAAAARKLSGKDAAAEAAKKHKGKEGADDRKAGKGAPPAASKATKAPAEKPTDAKPVKPAREEEAAEKKNREKEVREKAAPEKVAREKPAKEKEKKEPRAKDAAKSKTPSKRLARRKPK